jgi:hypothetical protein
MAWTSPRTWVAGEVATAANLNTHVRDNLKAIGDAWTSYTPTWTSTGSAPAIGNGSLAGAYILAGKLCHFRASVTFGTTTTFGTGAYSIGLPTAAITSPFYVATLMGWLDRNAGSGANRYQIQARVTTAGTVAPLFYVSVGTTGQLSNVTNTAPVALTATAGDVIHISGTYEAA